MCFGELADRLPNDQLALNILFPGAICDPQHYDISHYWCLALRVAATLPAFEYYCRVILHRLSDTFFSLLFSSLRNLSKRAHVQALIFSLFFPLFRSLTCHPLASLSSSFRFSQAHQCEYHLTASQQPHLLSGLALSFPFRHFTNPKAVLFSYLPVLEKFPWESKLRLTQPLAPRPSPRPSSCIRRIL